MSYQVYRASAAFKMLTSGRTFTGGLYGFLITLAKTVRETQANRIVLCQDCKPYKRSETYPEYKLLRKKNQDSDLLDLYKESMPMVLDAMADFGFPIWGIPGFESDDLMGHIVRQHRSRFSMIYAASNDSDLWQLLDCDWFRVFSDSLKSMMSRELLMKKFGLTPAEFMLATALSGTHNDIAGIDNVGPGRSRAAIKDPALMRKYRDGHNALIERNLELIRLPHALFPKDEPIPPRMKNFNARALYKWCGRYDIEVTKSMLDAFEQLQG
jgi:5'-3' exonuclease